MKHLAAVLLSFFVPCLFSAAPSEAILFDVTADWSDEFNPNGVWSYNGNGVPLPSVYRESDPWGVPQISWGDLPGWFRSNGTEQFDHDWVSGDVITHTPSAWDGFSDISWTSPEAGRVTISGAVWPCRDIWRWVQWTLVVDGTPISGGEVGSGDPYSRDHPMDFAFGTGGQGALMDIPVGAGSRIELRMSARDIGDYAGVRMVLDLTTAPVATRGAAWSEIKRAFR